MKQCAVCRHPIVMVHGDWRCERYCRCLMIGCVLDREDPSLYVSEVAK